MIHVINAPHSCVYKPSKSHCPALFLIPWRNKKMIWAGSILFAALLWSRGSQVRGDTPVNCMYEDVRGKWTFYTDEAGKDGSVDCNKTVVARETFKVELMFPDKVVDEFGNEGFWTMIYNQGFEVVVHGRKYFAFSKYTETEEKVVTSYCNETLIGWSHDVFGRDWSCFYGVRETPEHGDASLANGGHESWIHREKVDSSSSEDDDEYYRADEALIEKINRDTNLHWYAKKYEHFERMTNAEIRRLSSPKSTKCPALAPVTEEVRKMAAELPEEFDWRNRSGVSYVSPVRRQGHCGSCYAFASTAMNEARLKIATGGRVDVTLSPQDVVDCSVYSQGCDGGFPYLIGGKYAEDHGMVEEACYPYRAKDGVCNREARSKCAKHYFTNYQYIGGYYGGCNEELMRIALVNHGPIAVGFNVTTDFRHYGGDVFHTDDKQASNFNPFCETNHAVVIVGYGVRETTGMKYWIVKNSWGTSWGEDGYFRIRRGTNELGIESLAVQAFPIF